MEKEVADLVGAKVKRGGGREALSCAAFEKEVVFNSTSSTSRLPAALRRESTSDPPTLFASSFSTSTTRRRSQPTKPAATRRLIPDATCPRCKPSRSPEPNFLPEASLSIRSQPTKPAAPALHFGSNQVGHLLFDPLLRSSCSAPLPEASWVFSLFALRLSRTPTIMLGMMLDLLFTTPH